jgi:hypothetical protein
MEAFDDPRLDRVRGPIMSKPLVSLTISAADIVIDPEQRRAVEGAYRRGVHQAFALAGDLVDDAEALREARRLLQRAENIAGEFRYKRKAEGNGALLDAIRGRLSGRKRGDA